MRKLAIALALCTSLAASAQNIKAPQSLSPRTALLQKNRVQSKVSAYVTVNPSTLDRNAVTSLGVKLNFLTANIATTEVPVAVLAQLSKVEGVEYIQAATQANPMLDVARDEIGATKMQAGTDLPQGYTGKGVVVGIVDSGFDYGHAAFRGPDGELRIKRVWEQSAEAEGNHSAPERFGYGVELSTPEDIIAAAGDIRNNSHGTHVASIAAGSPQHANRSLYGMAPEADIVLVSMLYAGSSNVNISNAIAYIFDYAEETGQPCVVNLSLGNNSGPHDGTSTFDQLANAMQGPGRLIVGAAGNFVNQDFHLRHQFSGEDEPLRTFIDYKNSSLAYNTGGDIEIWMDAPKDDAEALPEVALVCYKLSTGAEQSRAKLDFAADEAQTLQLGRNISGSFAASAELSPLNGKLHVFLQSAVTAIRSDYGVALEISSPTARTLDIWADGNYVGLSSRDREGFTGPDLSYSTICEIGGTAERILTVGAYTTRAEYLKLGEIATSWLNETNGDLCSFSCYGPTADGRMKPEITAPGAYISAAVSKFDSSGTLTYSQFSDNDGQQDYYGFMQGTSMASPFVAGVVAAWLQAFPDMTPEQLRDIVKRTARHDDFTGDEAENPDSHWGWGKIDAYAGLKECLQLSGIADATISTCPDGVRIYDLRGVQVATDLSTPLPHGIYIIQTNDSLTARKIIR